MFDSLLEYMVINGSPVSLIVAMQVAFLCALRISEVIRLKHEHIIIEEDGSVWLDLANKAFKKGSGKPMRVRKPIEESEAMVTFPWGKVSGHRYADNNILYEGLSIYG